jgi:hypothetical protein
VIWIATIAAALALAFSARADVASTREALAAGALEAHWLYRLAGGHWDTLRWAVAIAAVALVVWATYEGGLWAWVAVGAAAIWSGYVWRAAARNLAVADEMRNAARAAGLAAHADTIGAGHGVPRAASEDWRER